MRIVESGPYEGHPIRRARKDYECEEWVSGWPEIKRCGATIPAGSDYVEGEVDPYRAGGFGHERVCIACARLPPPPQDTFSKEGGE